MMVKKEFAAKYVLKDGNNERWKNIYYSSFFVNTLVFTSTMAVYGEGNPPFDETHTPCPIDPYGVAKYACEMDIQIAIKHFQNLLDM